MAPVDIDILSGLESEYLAAFLYAPLDASEESGISVPFFLSGRGFGFRVSGAHSDFDFFFFFADDIAVLVGDFSFLFRAAAFVEDFILSDGDEILSASHPCLS